MTLNSISCAIEDCQSFTIDICLLDCPTPRTVWNTKQLVHVQIGSAFCDLHDYSGDILRMGYNNIRLDYNSVIWRMQ